MMEMNWKLMFIIMFFLICAVIVLIFAIKFSKDLQESLASGSVFKAIVEFFNKMIK